MLSDLCAALGLFLINGVSIEFPGITLGGLDYHFGLQSGNLAGQILGIVAVVLSVISILVSGLSGALRWTRRRGFVLSETLGLQPVSPNIPSNELPAQLRR